MSEVAHFEHEAEAARARIVDAIEQLSDRLSPQTIFREARDEGKKALLDARDDGMKALLDVRDQAADALDDIERSIVQNPAVFALGAVALGVAATAARRAVVGRGDHWVEPGDEYSRYAMGDNYAADAIRNGERGRGLRSRAAEGLDAARETVSGAANRAAAAVSRAADAAGRARESIAARFADVSGTAKARLSEVSDTLSDRADDAGERLAGAMDRARDGAADAANRVGRSVREGAAGAHDAIAANPEAAIVLGIVAGAILAVATDGRGFGADDAYD